MRSAVLAVAIGGVLFLPPAAPAQAPTPHTDPEPMRHDENSGGDIQVAIEAPGEASNETAQPTSRRHPGPWTRNDTLYAIFEASERRGSDIGLQTCMTWQESKLAPYARGDSGRSLGSAQLHEGGKLPEFYAMGYANPDDPYEAQDYFALALVRGEQRHWARAWGLCR